MNLDSAQRLEKVIEWSKLNINDFARLIGERNSTYLSAIIRKKKGINTKLYNKIITIFPEINRGWLLFGYGEMENKIDVLRGCFQIPTRAVIMSDDSMFPIISQHTYVVFKEKQSENIVSGEIYHVETKRISVIRMVVKSKDFKNEFILKPINDNGFDDIIVKTDDILKIRRAQYIIEKL